MSASYELNLAALARELEKLRSLVESGADVHAGEGCEAGGLLTFHPPVIAYLLSR